jgi:hypothetical protein
MEFAQAHRSISYPELTLQVVIRDLPQNRCDGFCSRQNRWANPVNPVELGEDFDLMLHSIEWTSLDSPSGFVSDGTGFDRWSGMFRFDTPQLRSKTERLGFLNGIFRCKTERLGFLNGIFRCKTETMGF